VQTVKAGTYADATELDLHRVVHELDNDHVFLVVRRDSAATDFAQALWREDERRYTVEYSTKSGRLQQTHVDSADEVHAILAGWAFNRRGWRSAHQWTSNANDDVVDFRAGCDWSVEGTDHVVAFTPLALTARGSTKDAALAELLSALHEATQDKETALKFSDWASANVVKRATLNARKP
jgi:hypothetical protein